MSKNTLFDKVWNRHTVRVLPNGQTQLFIGLHLIHEVTSPQAFPMLRTRGLKVRFPQRTFATVDHIVPTSIEGRKRPFMDMIADQMLSEIEKNCRESGITFFGLGDEGQGIVHVIGPELGLTQPGMTIACGDSHTSTHGAFGSIAFGIGTTQVANILASQCLLVQKPKVRQIKVNGELTHGVYAKDIILAIIGKLGVKGGIGYAYEYAGQAIEALDMEGRMTVCNMSIEGGATCGYVNPDMRTLNYLRGRKYAPQEKDWERFMDWSRDQISAPNAEFDDIVELDGKTIPPMVTWGITPGQVVGVDQNLPEDADPEALVFMDFKAGQPIIGTKVDVAFIGSCTNGRITDLREAASIVQKHGLKVAKGVKALVVPGSEMVLKQAVAEGLDEIFRNAGFDWRGAGCSMCLAMNPDKLVGRELCVSSSNRNFKGRQGSPTGRTLLMSPASVVASATAGEVTDVRQLIAS
ncbi:MAG TPA: 3-isopropylmalate dehydratase large subunit [Candidatus Paceibacterota bacterium]